MDQGRQKRRSTRLQSKEVWRGWFFPALGKLVIFLIVVALTREAVSLTINQIPVSPSQTEGACTASFIQLPSQPGDLSGCTPSSTSEIPFTTVDEVDEVDEVGPAAFPVQFAHRLDPIVRITVHIRQLVVRTHERLGRHPFHIQPFDAQRVGCFPQCSHGLPG